MSLSFSPISYLPLPNLTYFQKSPKTLVSVFCHPQTPTFFCCSHGRNPRKPNNIISDAELASDFAAEVHRLNTQSKERENAMKRSKQLLFSDLCNYLDMNPEDVKNNWKNFSTDEKMGLVKEFISYWGLNFHPLSPKSVKGLIDEFVFKDSEEIESSDHSSSNSDAILPTLKKIIKGFSSDH
ncbi:uncharacterized protein LOC130796999 [Amaranthus tricolor]|uniref:uncharacterized protein LOC130796999 n=1 Tax=Amaranthus tricolor TaxID=29722 RepID=UPI0025885FB5|nr:uncharacterized protein LOC130796999 [Amaranthus tricolor]